MFVNDRVSVTIVTYNSGRFIKRCLESVLAQRYPNTEIIVIDNASSDGTIDILEQFEDRCQITYNDENIGFAAAQNQAIRASSGDWVLTLNPDVLLLPNFIQSMVEAGQFSREQLHGEIQDLVSGGKIGRERDDERILIHTTGLVSQDVALAHFLYRNALEKGLGIWLPTAH